MTTKQPTETPRTDALRSQFTCPEDAHAPIEDFEAMERELTVARAEIAALRQSLSQIATNLGSGAVVSENASLKFIQQLPNEVKLVCDGQRAEIARLRNCAGLMASAIEQCKYAMTGKVKSSSHAWVISDEALIAWQSLKK